MVCVCWLVDCSTLDEDIPVIDEVNFDVICPSVVDTGDDEAKEVLLDDIVSSVEPFSSVDDSNVDVLIGDIAVAIAD